MVYIINIDTIYICVIGLVEYLRRDGAGENDEDFFLERDLESELDLFKKDVWELHSNFFHFFQSLQEE